jgi:TPR repeat protein
LPSIAMPRDEAAETAAQSNGVGPRVMAMFFAGLVAAIVLLHLIATDRARAIASMAAIASEATLQQAAGPTGVAGDASEPKPAPELMAILKTEARSPLGQSPVGVTRDEALALADQHLRGLGGHRASRAEAGYWLKHALRPSLSDPSLTWALSQLGSIYAAPAAGRPDFKAASLLWQVAASLGDPVATCFLARMHELGAGVQRDTETARRIYSMALKAGGCPGLMDALGRLQE